ncbi:translation elongation factor Ts [Aerococcus sp. 1KP-2016]|jgi:elongation factor Ts|uniref:translation elongation factor Ts n=1 Tax=Aerococcus sp. 1KP-2016 TaxID=1981982 RepID=UPI000B99C64A|nr:translation elongation factor Ts [Aerococcus sp. 1KP-2016]OYQ68190.1 translation elongation factor Ts [Aerococcus sp. 1KP-2016]
MAITAKQVKELRDRTGVGMMDAKKALVETDGDMEKAVDFLREKGISKAAKKADRIAAEGLTKAVVRGNEAVIVEINSETDFVARNEQFINLIDTVAFALIDQKPATVEAALTDVTIEGKDLDTYIKEKAAIIGEKISLRRFEVVSKTDSQEFGTYSHQGGRISVLTLIEGNNPEFAGMVAMHIGGMKPQYLNEDAVPAEVYEHEKAVLTEQSLNEGKPAAIVEKMITGRLRKFFAEICLVDQKYLLDDSKTVAEVAKENNAEVKGFFRYEVGEGIEKRQNDFASEVASQMGK